LAVTRQYLDEIGEDEGPVNVEILDLEQEGVTETEDGGVIIDLDGGATEEADSEHGANLAEGMDDNTLSNIASDLVDMFLSDKRSRKDWEKTYVKGLDLLGLQVEDRTEPWPNACGVFHPLLTEAIVRFQAQSITELFPAKGPAKVQIVGEETDEKIEQGKRVAAELNYQLTEKMTEFRAETEMMLFRLPMAGSAFKKVYFDPTLKRQVSMFCPAEDVVVSYGQSDLASTTRVTHIMRKPMNDIKKLMVAGFYRECDLTEPAPEFEEIENKKEDLMGDTPQIEHDDRVHVLEVMIDYDLPGYESEDGVALPYIISVSRQDQKVLSIYRNWDEEDDQRVKRDHFIHYQYLPGLGFYGIGLIHLIGGLAKSATSILRQLVDAGTLSNLPAGLKSRGLRIKGDDSPIMPGEFRDVDVPGGAIKDSITFLPYKEPSVVLYQLLGNLVEEGRRIGSVADLQIGDQSQTAPVGTTLALLERAMKVMSAVQARLHASFRKELKLIAGIIRDFLPEAYDYDVGVGDFSRKEDFDDRVDILPVSDPNASTMSQRIMQHQAALQLAGGAPHIYDLPQLHRQMLEVMGLENVDKLVPVEDDIEAMDPVQEAMAILTGKPIKAFIWQDHDAHIKAHVAIGEDPKIQKLVGQSPMAQQIAAQGAAHIQEHVAFQYRREIEKQLGVELPDPDKPIPQEVEVEMSRLIADAAEKLLGKNVSEAKAEKAAQQAEDPLIQMQKQELQIKQGELKRKADADRAKSDLDQSRIASQHAIAQARIQSEERKTGVQIGADVAIEKAKLDAEQKESGVKVGVEIARTLAQIEADRKRQKNELEERAKDREANRNNQGGE
jgi:hypothetical protein